MRKIIFEISAADNSSRIKDFLKSFGGPPARSAAPAAAAGVRPPGGEPEQDPALGGGHHRVFQLCPAPAGGAAGPALFVLIQNT